MHKLSPQADLLGAALIEPMAIATEGVHVKGQLQPNESVAVIGAGATGILSAVIAMEMGAKNVFFIGRTSSVETRFPIAKELGIIHCIDSSSTNPVKYVKEYNNGVHVDLVVDCSGNMAGFKTALELVKRNGRIVEIGSIHTDEPFPWSDAAFKAIDLKIVFSSSHEAWIKAVSIFNKSKVEFRKIISHEYSLDDYVDAFQIAQDSKKSFKVVFKPNQ
jgi:L-iditol 2-dehydrogenase